jgi:hypothetical protein
MWWFASRVTLITAEGAVERGGAPDVGDPERDQRDALLHAGRMRTTAVDVKVQSGRADADQYGSRRGLVEPLTR